MERQSKGFTLIELLVVFGIIILFSGIILVALVSVKNSGKDARIQASMDQLRKGAATYQSYQNSYVGLNCTVTNPVNIQMLCQDLDKQNSDSGGEPTFNSNENDYCAYVSMASSSDKWFCISSSDGKAEVTSINPDTACTGGIYNCP